jgi:predicted MFS family arabinose efflux permease
MQSAGNIVTADLDPIDTQEFTRGYRAWMLFILMLMNALNLADRQGLAAVAPALKRDLHLSDTELGVIQGLGFAIFYTLLGLPIARLSEHHNRARIIAASIAIFSVFGGLASQIRSFAMLLLCRIGVGIGDAGAIGPPLYSLLGDHYPAGKRGSATTVIWLGAPIGALAGAAIGGWTAQHAAWRMWFVWLAVPGFVAAALALLTLREPRRGAFDAGGITQGTIPSAREAMRFLFGKRSMRHVLLGAALCAIALNGMGQFFARYFVAVFHVGPGEAGKMLGMLVVVAMTSGFIIGGFGIDWAVRRDRRWYVWGPCISLAVAMPLFELGLFQPTVAGAMAILLPAHVALFIFYTPTLAIAQNMVDASMRASSAFTVAIVFGLVGIGLGPTLVGIISDHAASHYFGAGSFADQCPGGVARPGAEVAMSSACATASAHGIQIAMAAVTVLLLWGSLHYLLAARTLRTDLDARYRRPDAVA